MIADARNMTLVGHCDLDGRGDCMHVNVTGGHAYIGHQGYTSAGTSIVDVADPEHPRLVAQLPRPPGTHSHKVQVLGDLLLVNHERNRFESDPRSWSAGMAIYDVATPSRPRQVGFFPTPGTGVHRMTYWEPPYAYVSGTDEGFTGRILRIVDLSDPANPTEVGRWWFPGQNQSTQLGAAGEPPPNLDPGRDVGLHHALPRGDRLYAGWWDAGLVILDISDKERPSLVSHLEFGADSRNTHSACPLPGRDVLVVTDEQLTRYIGTQRHVRVVDVADDTRPKVLATFPVPAAAGDHHRRGIRFGPHNVHEPRPGSLIDPDTVYLTYFAGGLRAYDVSDPANPVETARLVPDPPPGRDAIQLNDVTATADGLVYVTDRHAGGLYIVHHAR